MYLRQKQGVRNLCRPTYIRVELSFKHASPQFSGFLAIYLSFPLVHEGPFVLKK
jgi:hypothetical protein